MATASSTLFGIDGNTCGFITGNPTSPQTCLPSAICAYDIPNSAAGCCLPDLTNCQIYTACLDLEDAATQCPVGDCPVVPSQLRCVSGAKPSCQTYVYAAPPNNVTWLGCGESAGLWAVGDVTLTTVLASAMESSGGASPVATLSSFQAVASSGGASTSTALSSNSLSLAATSSTVSKTGVVWSTAAANASAHASANTKIPIIVSVCSIVGSIVFLLLFWILFLRRKRQRKSEHPGSVKFADLLDRKRKSEGRLAPPTPGECSELDGKEKTLSSQDRSTDGRFELPG